MDRNHLASDRQSLALTHAALARIQAAPMLLAAVMSTLDHWDRTAPAESKPLRDAWRRLLTNSDWSLALDPGDRGQQPRQASPLGKALDKATRLQIIRSCKGSSSNT